MSVLVLITACKVLQISVAHYIVHHIVWSCYHVLHGMCLYLSQDKASLQTADAPLSSQLMVLVS